MNSEYIVGNNDEVIRSQTRHHKSATKKLGLSQTTFQSETDSSSDDQEISQDDQ